MAELGKAYVQIIPSAQGIGGVIEKSLAGEALTAGKSAGMNIAGALKGAIAAAGVGAVFKDIVGTGSEFEASMSQVAATLGYTLADIQNPASEAAQTMQQLGEFAQEMGATTAFSASQASEALNYMALAGYDAETSMTMLPNVLNLAAAGGLELASASDMVTDAQSALGLSIEETEALVDQMAATASSSNTSVGQLGEAILTVGGTAKDLAGGTTELNAALGVLANNGVKGAEGGTALRNILLSLTPKSEEAAKAMELIGFNAYDLNGELKPLDDTFKNMAISMEGMSTKERQNILSNMFNKVDLKSVNAMLAASSDGISKLSYALQSSSVDWENYASNPWMQAENAMSSFAQQVEYNLKDMGMSVEETAMFIASEYDMTFTDAVAAVQSVNDALDGSNSTWEDLTGKIQDADGAAEEMAKVQLENLAGDMKLFESALEGVKIAIFTGIAPALREVVQLGGQFLSALTTAIKTGDLSGLQEVGMSMVDAVVNGIKSAPSLIGTALEMIQGMVDGVMSALPQLLDAGAQMMDNVINGIENDLPGMLEKGVEMVSNIVNGILQNLPQLITSAGNLMAKFAEALYKLLPIILKAGVDLVLNLVKGIVNNFPAIVKAGQDAMTNIFKTIADNYPEMIQKGIELIGKLVSGLVDSIPSVVKGVGDIINNAKEAFFSVDWLSVGSDIVNGVISGISSAGGALFDSLKGLASDALSAAKKKLDINSPSKVFANEVGKWIPAGIAEGINDNTKALTDSIANVSDLATMDSKTLTGAYNYGSQIAGNYSGGNTINMTVYGAEGQNVNELADIIQDKINSAIYQKGAVFA